MKKILVIMMSIVVVAVFSACKSTQPDPRPDTEPKEIIKAHANPDYDGKTSIAVISADTNDQIAEPIRKILEAELVKLNVYDVVDRANINTILDEMSLSMSGLTEAANSKTAAKLMNAEKFVMVSVVQREVKVSAPVLTIKLIDAYSAKVEESWTKEILDPMNIANDVAAAAASLTEDTAFEAKVLKVMPENVLYIDKGSADGLKQGQTLRIKVISDILTDDDGNVLMKEERAVGRVTVLNADAKASKVRLYNSRDVQIKSGSALLLIR